MEQLYILRCKVAVGRRIFGWRRKIRLVQQIWAKNDREAIAEAAKQYAALNNPKTEPTLELARRQVPFHVHS